MESARAVARQLHASLGRHLRGVILHGSGVLGDYSPTRSDLDMLAVSARDLTDLSFGEVQDRLLSLQYPAGGLELSLLSRQDLLDARRPDPPFQIHLHTRTHESATRVVDGRGRAGDRGLVMHIAIARAHGYSAYGPDPQALLPVLPASLVLLGVRDELLWAATHGTVEYKVFTASRAMVYIATGRFLSKAQAAHWIRSDARSAWVTTFADARMLEVAAPAISSTELAALLGRAMAAVDAALRSADA